MFLGLRLDATNLLGNLLEVVLERRVLILKL